MTVLPDIELAIRSGAALLNIAIIQGLTIPLQPPGGIDHAICGEIAYAHRSISSPGTPALGGEPVVLVKPEIRAVHSCLMKRNGGCGIVCGGYF